MHTVFFIYQVAITSVLLILLMVTFYNVTRFRRMVIPQRDFESPTSTNASISRVSILVPARNEQRSIEMCIRSLSLQDYPDFEVIVLNDSSTDATGPILEFLAEELPNVRCISGSALPEGWVGKSWACWQLSKEATGEVFIFTDADTLHHANMVSAAVATLQEHNVEFFSAITEQVLGTSGEHIVIPMVLVLYCAYLPNGFITNNPNSSFSAANGQFMCFNRSAYEAVGGHSAVHNSLVEDVFLARKMKQMGYRIALVDGTHFISCRMYTSAREVTDGFSKNFFPGTGFNLWVTTAFLAHLVTAYTAPLLFLFTSWWEWAVVQLILAGMMRGAISLRFGLPWWHCLLQPLTGLWCTLIGINSVRWAYSDAGSSWKGRRYQHTQLRKPPSLN